MSQHSYTIQLHKSVQKFLQSHPEAMKRFFEKAKILSVNPYDASLDIQSYQGHPHCFRLRIGKRRFLYEIIEEKITIYFFGADSRGDVYK